MTAYFRAVRTHGVMVLIPVEQTMAQTERDLRSEGEAAKTLLAQYADVVAGDEEAASTLVEGETSLIQAIDRAVARVQELEAHVEAIRTQTDKLTGRRERLERQAEALRAAIVVAMADGGLRKVELAGATVSLTPLRARPVILDEALVPASYWRPGKPTLDRSKLAAALAEGGVPGACLSNGGQTITIRGG